MHRNLVLAAVVACAACGSATQAGSGPVHDRTVRVVGGTGGTTQITTTAVGESRVGVVDRPRADVWAAAPAVYAGLGIDITHRQNQQGIVGNPGFKVRRRLGSAPLSRYLDCGTTQGGPSADSYEVHLSVLTEITERDAGSATVSTSVQATARPVTFAGEAVACVSRGELENRILVGLMAKP